MLKRERAARFVSRRQVMKNCGSIGDRRVCTQPFEYPNSLLERLQSFFCELRRNQCLTKGELCILYKLDRLLKRPGRRIDDPMGRRFGAVE